MHFHRLILVCAYFLVFPIVYASEGEPEYLSIDDMEDTSKWSVVTLSETALSISVDNIYVKEGSGSLKLEYSGRTTGCEECYGGIHFSKRDFSDWKNYEGLEFWVYNLGETEIEVEVRLDENTPDRKKSKYLIKRYLRTKGWHNIEVPFTDFWWDSGSDIRLPFELNNFNTIRLKFMSNAPSFTIYVDDLKLYKTSGKISLAPIVLFDETHDEWRSISSEKANELYEKYPTIHTDYPSRKVEDFDYSPFVRVLESTGLKPVRLLEPPITLEKIRDASVVAIFAPQNRFLEEEKKAIYEYVYNGGSLVSGDLWFSGRNLLREFGIEISGYGVRAKDGLNYRTLKQQEHPITQDVKVYMHNSPLIYRCKECTVLLKTPADVYVDENRNEKYDEDEPVGSFPVLVYKDVGKGKVLVIAQSYIFAKDNEDYNSEFFTKKVFSWLAGLSMPEEGKLEGLPQTLKSPPKIMMIEETDPSFVWSGVWLTEDNPGASGGTWKVTGDINAKVDISFTGTGIALISGVHPNLGIAGVEIDRVSYPDIDLYSNVPSQVKKVIATDLENGPHVLTIKVTGKKNPLATNHVVLVDAIEVYEQGADIYGEEGITASAQKRTFFGPSIDRNLPNLLTDPSFLLFAPLILGFLTLLIQLLRGA